MSNETGCERPSNVSIAFFGRRCPFTGIPFERLTRAGISISALFLATSAPTGAAVRLRRYRPAITLGQRDESIERLAGERAIPCYDVRRPLGDELRAAMREHAPDLVVAACFPWHIPASIRTITRLGGVNLHPSPLPRFRGPDPLFWAYESGAREWGVTVHRLCDSFDAGAILAQTRFEIENELPGDHLERRCAEIGADLLVDVIRRAGAKPLDGSAQDESAASYQSWPTDEQLLIKHHWSVQRALNFVTGVRPLGYEPKVSTPIGSRTVRLARRAPSGVSSTDEWIDEHTIRQQFADGTLEFTID